MKKIDDLIQAAAARTDEVAGYQINIDNYQRAIAKIAKEHAGTSDMDVAMQEFSGQLADGLRASLIEQRKAQIILEVITDQLEQPQ